MWLGEFVLDKFFWGSQFLTIGDQIWHGVQKKKLPNGWSSSRKYITIPYKEKHLTAVHYNPYIYNLVPVSVCVCVRF